MWKDKISGKGLKNIYTKFRVSGLNLDRFIESLKRKNIAIYNAKKFGNKKLIFMVNYVDSEKIFAINKEMWYNAYIIEKLGERGRGYPLLYLYRNIGIFVGVLLFVAIAYISNDFIFSFSFTGTGSIYSKDITKYLKEKGINTFTRFSSLDLPRLEDEILKDNDSISFASVKKSGNRLVIDVALSTSSPQRLKGNVDALYSNVSGVVEQIKVYRGTATVSVGDSVNSGDLLITGYMTIKENTVKVNVCGCVSILYQVEYNYISNLNNQNDMAIIMAKEKLDIDDEVDVKIVVTKNKTEYNYKVAFTLRKVLQVG